MALSFFKGAPRGQRRASVEVYAEGAEDSGAARPTLAARLLLRLNPLAWFTSATALDTGECIRVAGGVGGVQLALAVGGWVQGSRVSLPGGWGPR